MVQIPTAGIAREVGEVAAELINKAHPNMWFGRLGTTASKNILEQMDSRKLSKLMAAANRGPNGKLTSVTGLTLTQEELGILQKYMDVNSKVPGFGSKVAETAWNNKGKIGLGVGGTAVAGSLLAPGIAANLSAEDPQADGASVASGAQGKGVDLLETLKENGVTFGLGSIVAAAAAFAGGSYAFESPWLGAGLAIGAGFVGQPILDFAIKAFESFTKKAPETPHDALIKQLDKTQKAIDQEKHIDLGPDPAKAAAEEKAKADALKAVSQPPAPASDKPIVEQIDDHFKQGAPKTPAPSSPGQGQGQGNSPAP